MFTYHKYGPVTFIWGQFHERYLSHWPLKSAWNLLIWNLLWIIQGPMSHEVIALILWSSQCVISKHINTHIQQWVTIYKSVEYNIIEINPVLEHKEENKLFYYIQSTLMISTQERVLTHWGQDKMAGICRRQFQVHFLERKMYEFRLWFHWSLFLRFQSTIFQPRFR